MSLIYSRNSIGPNILPCGTPHVMNFCSERISPLSITPTILVYRSSTVWVVNLFFLEAKLVFVNNVVFIKEI